MNLSCVIAKTAGMESTAKIKSVVSTTTSTSNSGVAQSFVFRQPHFQTADDENRAEKIDHPVKMLEQRHAGHDEDCPEHQRTENSPEQNWVLMFSRDGEIRKQHQKNKKIIHAQRFFDEVAGEKLQRRFFASVMRDQTGKTDRQRNPHRTPTDGFSETDRPRSPVKHAEVERQHSQHQHTENRPQERVCCHAGSVRRPVKIVNRSLPVCIVDLGQRAV